jgi:hypothetical protein
MGVGLEFEGRAMKGWSLWLALGASAVVLAACSTTTPPPMALTPNAAGAAKSPPADMVWNYREAPGGKVHLSYGVPDSDIAGIMFDCGRRAAAVGFATDLEKGKPGPGAVRFRSGKTEGRYAARLERSELTGGWDAIGEIPLADPVLAGFEKTGQISQVEDAVYAQNARSAAERSNIKRFFGFCRG